MERTTSRCACSAAVCVGTQASFVCLVTCFSWILNPHGIHHHTRSIYRSKNCRQWLQELCDKVSQLPSDIEWHFIGHLQSNKAKVLVQSCPNLALLETIDSEKLANKVDAAVEAAGRSPLPILIQVQYFSPPSNTLEDVDMLLSSAWHNTEVVPSRRCKLDPAIQNFSVCKRYLADHCYCHSPANGNREICSCCHHSFCNTHHSFRSTEYVCCRHATA